jgi:hypothetical protein
MAILKALLVMAGVAEVVAQLMWCSLALICSGRLKSSRHHDELHQQVSFV